MLIALTHAHKEVAMTVLVGHSAKVAAPKPLHLVAELAGSRVMACSGSRAVDIREVPKDAQAVYEELGCGECRRFWKRVVNVGGR